MIFAPQLKLCKNKNLSLYFEGNYTYPINIEISLTGKCNANCPECFYRDGKKDCVEIDINYLLNFLRPGEQYLRAITWTGGGEPTLHSQFEFITDYIHTYTLLEQGLFTNALKEILYNPKDFNWIRVSKTNYDWPVDNIKSLRKDNKNVGLCINYNGNDNDIETGLKIVHDNNLRYLNVRPALNTCGKTIDIKPPTIKDEKLIISKYKFDQASKKKDYKKCYGYKFVPFLWHTGNLDVCAYHQNNSAYNIGNIYKESYEELIKNINDLPYAKVIDSC